MGRRSTQQRGVLVGLLSGHVVEWMDGKEKRNNFVLSNTGWVTTMYGV